MKVEWKSCAKIGVSAFLLYLCITYWFCFANLITALFRAAMPLLIGCVIAYIINILMHFYEQHYFPTTKSVNLKKSRRPVCLLAAFATLIIIVSIIAILVIPELISCVELLVSQIPGAVSSFVKWLESKDAVPENILASVSSIDWKEKMDQVIGMLTTGVGNVLGTAINAVSSLFSNVVTALLALIFSIYCLLSKEKLGNQFDRLIKRYMQTDHYSKIKYVLFVMNECFHKYIVGQCTEAVILGTLCAIGMLILRIPYAAMTGAVIAFTALIPVAGAYIGAAVGAFMIMTVSPVKAVIFLIFLVILQQVEGNMIYPRVVGASMGLPAIWVLAAVTVGGGMMGILGMLLSVPLTAVIYRLLREDVNRGLDKEAVKP